MRSALTAAALALATPALADNCHLTQLASVDMQPLSRDNVVLVPASINGKQVHMLLDTGGLSGLSEKTVEAFNLARQDSYVKALDVGGNASRQMVRLDTLELGQLKGKNVRMMILPGLGDGLDGLIAGDLLNRYDVELNFATRKLNLFSQDHCRGKVIYWPASAGTVVPFSMVPPGGGNPANWATGGNTHIYVPVMLDGKPFEAMVDTGTTFTVMSADAAEHVFSLDAKSPGSTPINDPGNQRFSYVFHTLSIGGITASNPRVVIHSFSVGKNDPDNMAVTGSMTMRTDDGLLPELIIGMDVLSHLHVYIAYGEHNLYITPPDQPAATEH